MIAHTIDPEQAHCWRCGVWLLGSQRIVGDGRGDGRGNGVGYGNYGDGYGNGDGWGNGEGNGNGRGNGYGWGYGYGGGNGRGYGFGTPLPLCDDALACACRQPVRSLLRATVGGKRNKRKNQETETDHEFA